MSAELFFFLSSYKYLALLPNPNKANSPYQQAIIKKHSDATQLRRLLKPIFIDF